MDEDRLLNFTVSPDMIVADILSTWPGAIPVFLKHQMSCVGCSMAAFETLADALHIYNLPVDDFLTEIEAALREAGA